MKTLRCAPVLAALWLAAPQIHAQSFLFVGSEAERYAQWLQLANFPPSHPWTLRPFSQMEVPALTPTGQGHPWRTRIARHASGITLDVLAPSLTTYFNSSFPWGFNDGAVWQGRGLTTAFQAGFHARIGPLSATVAPQAFWAQNAEFELQNNRRTDSLKFAHGVRPFNIDAPQRFGDGAYARVDPGQSTLRLDLPFVTVGFSTANQWWGPAVAHPLLMSNNAPGFPHVFVGSSTPLDLWIARVHGRLIWADLRQSPYTRNLPPNDRRFFSALVALLMPRGIPGLEVGAARLSHDLWPDSGLRFSHLTAPFQAILRSGRPPGDDPLNPGAFPDNQMASVWFRWAPPRSGFEFYGEYGKEDDNWDLRDIVIEPENSGGWVLGFRKLWGASPRGFWGVSAEQLDTRPSQYRMGRSGGAFYVHSRTLQGHTYRGQILGSEFGWGGLATTVALDRYHEGGRWRVSWLRLQRQDTDRLTAKGGMAGVGPPRPDGYDMMQAVGADAVVFRGPWELSAGVTVVYELNRYLEGRDAVNLNARVGVQRALGVGREPRESMREGGEARQAGGVREPEAADSSGVAWVSPFDLSGRDAERRRLRQALGVEPSAGFLLRSPAGTLVGEPAARPAATPLPLETRWIHNTALPFSLNDGPLWAGAGNNVLVTGGFAARWGPATLVLAPQAVWSANRAFTMPDTAFLPLPLPPTRDSLASPWFIRPHSIDQPLRFGTEPVVRLYPGQSTLAVRHDWLTAGVSTQNRWWGPGVKNAIVLSDNAPGWPHAFLATARPIATRAGDFEGIWLVGALRESRYFDADPANDLRSLAAVAATWTPAWVPDLTVGFARAVYSSASDWGDVALDGLDALFSNPGRPNNLPESDSTQTRGADQIYAWLGRWRFPAAGLEVYGEFAKTELPSSLREFLSVAGHTLGYTLGFQWVRPIAARRRPGPGGTQSVRIPQSVIRLSAEHTWLERSSTFRQQPLAPYYTSRAVEQGYTNEGQVLGAGIGPGSSSHWLALDYVTRTWEVGLFGYRIRWNNDALYSARRASPSINYWCMHDVSVLGGVRGGADTSIGSFSATLATGTRFNLYFQHRVGCGLPFTPEQVTDVRNTTLDIRYTLRF